MIRDSLSRNYLQQLDLDDTPDNYAFLFLTYKTRDLTALFPGCVYRAC